MSLHKCPMLLKDKPQNSAMIRITMKDWKLRFVKSLGLMYSLVHQALKISWLCNWIRQHQLHATSWAWRVAPFIFSLNKCDLNMIFKSRRRDPITGWYKCQQFLQFHSPCGSFSRYGVMPKKLCHKVIKSNMVAANLCSVLNRMNLQGLHNFVRLQYTVLCE